MPVKMLSHNTMETKVETRDRLTECFEGDTLNCGHQLEPSHSVASAPRSSETVADATTRKLLPGISWPSDCADRHQRSQCLGFVVLNVTSAAVEYRSRYTGRREALIQVSAKLYPPTLDATHSLKPNFHARRTWASQSSSCPTSWSAWGSPWSRRTRRPWTSSGAAPVRTADPAFSSLSDPKKNVRTISRGRPGAHS